MMSVSSTSKVSSSVSVNKVAGRSSTGANSYRQQVEAIDASNNISVDVAMNDKNGNGAQKEPDKEKESKDKKALTGSGNVARSTIEALNASGVYEETDEKDNSKVGVYNNNQTIIRKDMYPAHKYAKKFYEENEIIEEIDEFA